LGRLSIGADRRDVVRTVIAVTAATRQKENNRSRQREYLTVSSKSLHEGFLLGILFTKFSNNLPFLMKTHSLMHRLNLIKKKEEGLLYPLVHNSHRTAFLSCFIKVYLRSQSMSTNPFL
jgi:hypothetical protein